VARRHAKKPLKPNQTGSKAITAWGPQIQL